MGKRIVFMGAGAVGGYVGGHIARTGEDVTLLDPWPEHIEYIKHNGIHSWCRCRTVSMKSASPTSWAGARLSDALPVSEEVGILAPTHAALTKVVQRVESGEIEAHPRNVEGL